MDIENILELHKKWVKNDDGGARAYLRGADLTGADLTGADLRGADLTGADIIGFYLGKYFGFAHKNDKYENGVYVKIGCLGNSLQWWLNNYEESGKENGYPDDMIRRYGSFLKWLDLECKS